MKREWPESFPQVIRDLNLDAPALLEASAGTGKTYAIEHLVLRLVAEKPDWKFESLLLLSFTEKTAGDLRKRIRERLKEESRNPFWTADERHRFFEAHLRCDEASIHTFHGFCHAILRAHALENGTLFDSEIAPERELLDTALDALLRGPWAHDETRLRERLQAFAAHKDWRKYLIDIAVAYQPGREDAILPVSSPERFRKSEEELLVAARELHDTYRTFDGTLRKGVFFNIRNKLEQTESPDSLSGFFLRLRKNSTAVKKGFTACLTKTAAKDPQWLALADACQNFFDAAKIREEQDRLRSFSLIAEAVRELRQRLVREKKRLGVLTYDDMVLRLVTAVRTRPVLVEQLRERYHACVVDEFQDTDPLQWELLERLCLKAENGPPLFLVGDPKQAIYGFRGGDLRTYFVARNRLHALSEKNLAQGTGLRENWRSAPQLINALNAVFSQPIWFDIAEIETGLQAWKLPKPSDHIPFTYAEVPTPHINGGAEALLILRDFKDCETKGEAQKSVQAWIASKIHGLTSIIPPLTGGLEGVTRADIAILTRTNPEALAMERHLRRQGIPCRVRRRGGVFDGTEADQLRLLFALLQSIRDPKTQAQILLLPFLRTPETGWPQGLPEKCPPAIQQWATLADAGKWSEFFHAFLHESGYLHRLAVETNGGAEVHTWLNLERVLTEEGLRHRHSLRGLLRAFDALRRGDSEETSAASNDDTEDRVTIMTLHLSKGLEFPVVFLASLSESRKPAFYTLRDQTGFRHVLDKKDAVAIQEYQNQTLEEDKRLFYVGLTRAKNLLHIPLLPEKFSRTGSGPLGGFAAGALRKAATDHPGLFHVDEEPLFTPPVLLHVESNILEDASEKDASEEVGAFFHARRRRLASYSKLLKHEAATVVEEDGRRVNRDETEAEDAMDEQTETVSAIDLPPGANTGNALHELFETVDFAAVGKVSDPASFGDDSRLLETAGQFLRLQGLSEDYAAAALRLVWNTLRMPLPDPAGGPAFRLADITDRKHEMEFLFPFASLSPPEGGDGFLWGFMDLIFRHEGRYYLLDWKSNLLDRYGSRDIEADMQKHHYDLQYQLYSVALDRWLQARLPHYNPAEHFGGVFYLYLRGASTKGGFSGFTCRPNTIELRETYPARLRNALGLELE